MSIVLAVLAWTACGFPPAIHVLRWAYADDPDDSTGFGPLLAGLALLCGPLSTACWIALLTVLGVRWIAVPQYRRDVLAERAATERDRIRAERRQIDEAHRKLGLPAMTWPDLPQ